MGALKALRVATLLCAASAAAQVTVTVTQNDPYPVLTSEYGPSPAPSPESSSSSASTFIIPSPASGFTAVSHSISTGQSVFIITSDVQQPLSSPLTCYGTTLSTLDQNLCCPGRFVSTPGPDAYCCIQMIDVPLTTFGNCYPTCGGIPQSLTQTPMSNPEAALCQATAHVTDPNYTATVAGFGAYSWRPMSTPEPLATGIRPGATSTSVSKVTILTGISPTTTATNSSSSGSAAQVTSGPLAGAVMMIAGGLLAVL